MLGRLFAAFAFGALAFSPLAACEASRTEAKPEAEPGALPSPAVIAYGDRNTACLEWSDSCVVCTRDADGAHCSTPGIACQPGEIACKRRAE